MTISQNILLETHSHMQTYTIESLERTNDARLKVFEMHDSESKAVKIV